MDRLSQLDRDELVRRMRADFEQTLLEVADAVNAAGDGHLIDGSEERVRDLLGDFRRRAFQTAAQMRLDQEFMADRRAAQSFGPLQAYASSLVKIATPAVEAGPIGDQSRVPDPRLPGDALRHLVGIGELRNPVGADEGPELDALQSRVGQRLHEAEPRVDRQLG